MNLTELDLWIVVTAALFGVACSLPGCFLLVGKHSMMSHGISHAVLPGIVIAYLVTGEVNTFYLLVGAVVSGIVCVALTKSLQQVSGIDSGSALGISFTTLFAIGLILQRLLADHVHIEPSHVLFGNLEMAVFDFETPPHIVWRALLIAVINLIFIVSFFKEFRLATFDPQHGDSVASRPQLIYYLLMLLSAITAVMAFEAVGSILVVSMMIIPPAIAYQMTSSLRVMIILSIVFSFVIAMIGHLLSLKFFGAMIGGWFGIEASSTSSAGGMAVFSGLLLIGVILLKRVKPKSKLPSS